MGIQKRNLASCDPGDPWRKLDLRPVLDMAKLENARPGQLEIAGIVEIKP